MVGIPTEFDLEYIRNCHEEFKAEQPGVCDNFVEYCNGNFRPSPYSNGRYIEKEDPIYLLELSKQPHCTIHAASVGVV